MLGAVETVPFFGEDGDDAGERALARAKRSVFGGVARQLDVAEDIADGSCRGFTLSHGVDMGAGTLQGDYLGIEACPRQGFERGVRFGLCVCFLVRFCSI